MKILLAVTSSNDATETGRYLAERFGRQALDIDVLTVIPQPELIPYPDEEQAVHHKELQAQHRLHDAACSMVAAFESQLRFSAKVRSVRTYVEYGDPAEVILNFSRQLRSEVLLIGAPERQGVLTAFKVDGVTRRILKWAECPVELFRTSGQDNVRNRILVPLPLNEQETFELPPLEQLGWSAGSHLHLLGIMPNTIEENRVEANPAAMLVRLQECRDRWGAAKNRLARLCESLAARLPDTVKLSHELQQGKPSEVLTRSANELLPSLVVLDRHWNAGEKRSSLFSSLAPMSVVMGLPCSVAHITNQAQTQETVSFTESSGLAH